MPNEQRIVRDFARINGADLYYEVVGNGYPLVLVHGGAMDSRQWDDQFLQFAQHYKVVRYDVRANGKSSQPELPFSFMEDLRGLLTFLGIERAYVVGSGGGAAIAVDLALAHPAVVDALVLAPPRAIGNSWSPELLSKHEPMNAALKRGDIEGTVEARMRIWIDGPSRTPDQVDSDFRARVRGMMIDHYHLVLQHPTPGKIRALDPPALTRLHEVRPRTLLVVGEHDEPESLAIADKMEAEIALATKVVIEGACSTAVNMEKPESFNPLVLDFLRES